METWIEVNKKEINGIIIYNLKWELDETNADKTFIELIKWIWDYKNKKLLLNFDWLNYLNSKSIGYLADIFSNLEDNNWDLIISNCSEQVKDILDIVWLTGIIKTVKTEEEAISILK
jgi:anti-anti-sigma factor